MSKKKLLLVLFSFTSLFAFSQFPASVKEIVAKPNGTVSVRGDLSQGKKMTDLGWAARSSVACFPGTQNSKFSGHHVLFHTKLPRRAKMYIKLIPDNPGSDMSLYAYSIGTTNYSLVPNLSSCVSCEAEHKWDYPKKGKTQDHTREVMLNAINNPYNVVIGVAGSKGLPTGGFRIQVRLIGGEPAASNAPQEKVTVKLLRAEKGKVLSYKGNLNQGVILNDLSWAWRSSVACFPGTQKEKFTGNHVIYTVELPRYSEMDINVIPKNPNANFSLYAYSIGSTSDAIVPNLSSCVSCEADHKWDYPKKGKTQDHTRSVSMNAINNPYKVVIGVAGANELKTGEYTLQVSLKSR